MSIMIPLILAVMPMSIGPDSVLLVVALLSTLSCAALYASRLPVEDRAAAADAVAGLFAQDKTSRGRRAARDDAAVHDARIEAVAELYAAASAARIRAGQARPGFARENWFGSAQAGNA
jgi:hypothetical protein